MKKAFKILFILTTVLTVGAFWGAIAYVYVQKDTMGEIPLGCFLKEKVGVVRLHGAIDIDENPAAGTVSGDRIAYLIDILEQNKSIHTIVLDIDSPGGTPVAAETIMQAMLRSKKKTVALVRNVAASGGYMAAVGASEIYASAFSEVGSIGITMSYLDQSKKDEAEGLTYVQLSTGKYKDTGSPDKAITEEEKTLLKKGLQNAHDFFVSLVSDHRKIPKEEVEKLADGSTLPASEALTHKLIDKIGNLSDVLVASDAGPTEYCYMN